MRHILAAVLGIALCATAATVELDGSLQEWTGGDVVSYGTVKTSIKHVVSEHTLYQTEDNGTLYYGIADTVANDNVISIAIDLDGIADSATAAKADTYNSITFTGSYSAEFVLYAGVNGGDTFVYSVWDGSKWQDHTLSKGVSFDGSTTGLSVISTDLGVEYAIDFAALGLDSYTAYARSWVVAGKNETAKSKLYGWGIGVGGDAGDGLVQTPEPATLAMLGLGGLLARRKRKA